MCKAATFRRKAATNPTTSAPSAPPITAPPRTVGGDPDARHPLARLNFPALILIRTYQLVLSPLLGRQCRFIPTCSMYAHEAFRRHHPIRAVRLTLWRIARCQPMTMGGYDPVPGYEPKRRTSEGAD